MKFSAAFISMSLRARFLTYALASGEASTLPDSAGTGRFRKSSPAPSIIRAMPPMINGASERRPEAAMGTDPIFQLEARGHESRAQVHHLVYRSTRTMSRRGGALVPV